MKKLLIMFLLLMSTTACSSNYIRATKKHNGIHEEFKPYVQEFIYLSRGKVTEETFKGFSMGFTKYDEDDDTVGYCHYNIYEVDISEDWWKKKSQSEKLELVFHEFGHCILKRGHSWKPFNTSFMRWLERLGFDLGIFEETPYLWDGCPGSFMHPYTISERCINRHFYYYVEELFKNIPETYVEKRMFSEKKRKCPDPKVINKTDTWNKRDQDTLNRAKTKCIDEYKSCLKTFIKKDESTYSAICG